MPEGDKILSKTTVRLGTAANWTLANPTLSLQELGFESDTGRYKIGNGSTQWTSLGYFDDVGPNHNKSYEVATVPTASSWTGSSILVTNETGGSVLAFSDGTNWRRVTDRAIVSA